LIPGRRSSRGGKTCPPLGDGSAWACLAHAISLCVFVPSWFKNPSRALAHQSLLWGNNRRHIATPLATKRGPAAETALARLTVERGRGIAFLLSLTRDTMFCWLAGIRARSTTGEDRMDNSIKHMIRQLVVRCFPVCCLAFVCSCANSSDPPKMKELAPPTKPTVNLISAADLHQERIAYQFAIYYTPKPTKEPRGELESLLKQKFPIFRHAQSIGGHETAPSVADRFESNPKSAYPPPDLQALQYFGRGVTRTQAEAVQKTQGVLLLDFGYANEHVWDGMRSALQLTDSVARATGGLIWDDETRELFSPDAWKQRRITDWSEKVPDITKHMVIHAYQKGEAVRAITLGLAKFGLPDVVVENFSWSLNRNMGNIVSLFAQAIAEGATIRTPGQFDLNIKAIKTSQVRDPQVKSLLSNATGIAALSLRKASWEEGDPRNRLIEITFERGVGPDLPAKANQILSTAFGSEDSVIRVNHDEALEAASRQARKKLPELRKEFIKGLAPGEFIIVKAPFGTPNNGQEWMWVEVMSWNGDKIRGLLRSEPLEVPSLHAGQEVNVSEKEVFDYIRKHADGTTEGNETAKLIKDRSQ
jgi:uncharacterized protein YegJ (DUF2314 family)